MTNTMLYIGMIVGQLPVNRINQILPLGTLLASSMISWGLVSLANHRTVLLANTLFLQFVLIMGFVKDFRPIFALRLLLGISQAIFGPCLLRMSSIWYRKTEQPTITAAYQSMLGVASIISSLLGYGE